MIADSTPDPWPDLLNLRAKKLCPSLEGSICSGFLRSHEFASNKKMLGIGPMMIVIKTWANSWSTSDRYQEDLRLPCIFGCSQYEGCPMGAKDFLTHYLTCPILWHLIVSSLRQPVFIATLQPVQFACMDRPVQNDFKRICIAFKCYHAIRLSHPELVKRAIKSKVFDEIHLLLLEYVRQFADELSLRYDVAS